MADRENYIEVLSKTVKTVNKDAPIKISLECIEDILELLKEQEAREVPEELKQQMWNALYAEEDKYEKKYIGTEEHDGWFFIYRPWLQKGFNLAIEAIANWEGR